MEQTKNGQGFPTLITEFTGTVTSYYLNWQKNERKDDWQVPVPV